MIMDDLSSTMVYLETMVREFVNSEHLTPPPIGWDKVRFGNHFGDFELHIPCVDIEPAHPDVSAHIILGIADYGDAPYRVNTSAQAYKLTNRREQWSGQYSNLEVRREKAFEDQFYSELQRALTDLTQNAGRLDKPYEEREKRLQELRKELDNLGIEHNL